MSDTIEAVTYRPAGTSRFTGGFVFGSFEISRHKVLEETLAALGLTDELKRLFPSTKPPWYGLWIESPLTPERNEFLEKLFTAIEKRKSPYQQEFAEFVKALRDSRQSGIPLEVNLSPPGHVDFGCITTFVHCPRCKMDGPFEPWQESYPTEPIECATCGHWYSPAATHSMETMYFATEIHCLRCGGSHRINDFPEPDRDLLSWHNEYRECHIELLWLSRIAAYYRRNPKLTRREDRPIDFAQPEFDAASILSPLIINLPMENAVSFLGSIGLSNPREEDIAVRRYLSRHHFWLTRRVKGCHETIADLALLVGSQFVRCPQCGWGLAPQMVDVDDDNGDFPDGSPFLGIVPPDELELRNCHRCGTELSVRRPQMFPDICIKCIDARDAEARLEERRQNLRKKNLPTVTSLTAGDLIELARPSFRLPELSTLKDLECLLIGRDGEVWKFAIPGEWPSGENEYSVIVDALQIQFNFKVLCVAVARSEFEEAVKQLRRDERSSQIN